MSNLNLQVLVPIVLYFIAMYFIGIYAAKLLSKVKKSKNGDGTEYMDEFMTGGRDTGGFVLAMTLVATYLSAGSFIGGPGTAYTHGLAWVFLAMAQMPTGYYTLAVLGKKFAIVSRKINANSITDFLRVRYESKAVVIISSLSIIFFLIAAMAAQWIGAARLLQGSTGIDYTIALAFFGITVVVHTAIGGYRGVVLNDTMQGIVMTISTLALFTVVLVKGGGIANIVQNMKAIDPGMITPFGVQDGFMTKPWVTSYWVLVGFAVVGFPSVSQRAMSYKDSKSLNSGIKVGTLVSILILTGMHLVGAFGSTLVSGISSGDLVVPTLAVTLFPSVIAGIILSGPLAAVMSTVDSQLLVVVGAIVNDLIINYIKPKFAKDSHKVSRWTIGWAVIVGIIIFLVSMEPPELMVWLNLFATAGQLSTFLWPTILGLYWKKANKEGAIASMIVGIGSYIIHNYYLPRPFGLHAIVPSLLYSLLAFIIVSKITKPPSKQTIQTFWGI
ncbi:sodium/panthothenate symporter [Tissierella sp. P1]|uniref:sodium/pantothenate symporter n=1 Tax=Tissierella sp. P1 TaxID=1280483 RepID=UPI000BA1738D|nr:sodium/pantothenate symporter [Tissierella sp. P1]OZV10945.1 sodium/panthothenate symporter [Tissierella sp. P1]